MKKLLLVLSITSLVELLSGQSWNWVASPTSTSFARFDAIIVDPAGYTYACGVFNDTAWFGPFVVASPTPWPSRAFVAKYDPSGNCVWASADTSKANAFDIVIDAAGNSYVAGNMNSQFFLTKWDSGGTKLWETLLPANASAFDLLVDGAGNIIAGGKLTAGSAQFGSDVLSGPCGFVAKYDSNGSALEAFRIGSYGKIDPTCMILSSTGDIEIAATLSGADTILTQPFFCEGTTVLMLKFDTNGNLIWWNDAQAPAPGNAYLSPYDICIDATDNVYVTCSSATQDFLFDNDTLFMHPNTISPGLIKYDGTGNVVWLNQADFTGTGSIHFLQVACDQNEVYLTGYTETDFSVQTLAVVNTTNAYYLFYMMAMDLNGNPLYEAHTTGNISIALPRDITVDATGTIWIAGMHSNAPSFGPFAMQDPPSGVDYAFLVQLEGSGLGISQPSSPPPVALRNGNELNSFVLEVDKMVPRGNTRFLLYDMTGRVVKSQALQGETTTIDCRDVSAGTYIWSVENSTERFCSGKLLNQ